MAQKTNPMFRKSGLTQPYKYTTQPTLTKNRSTESIQHIFFLQWIIPLMFKFGFRAELLYRFLSKYWKNPKARKIIYPGWTIKNDQHWQFYFKYTPGGWFKLGFGDYFYFVPSLTLGLGAFKDTLWTKVYIFSYNGWLVLKWSMLNYRVPPRPLPTRFRKLKHIWKKKTRNQSYWF